MRGVLLKVFNHIGDWKEAVQLLGVKHQTALGWVDKQKEDGTRRKHDGHRKPTLNYSNDVAVMLGLL